MNELNSSSCLLARNYNPVTGRFLSVDPMASKFPAWSPYNYTMNNPMINVDPTGMEVRTSDSTSAATIANDINSLHNGANVSFEKRTEKKNTLLSFLGLADPETIEYYAITVDPNSSYDCGQDKYSAALFETILSIDVVFDVKLSETIPFLGSDKNAQDFGGGFLDSNGGSKATAYIDPRGDLRTGTPRSVLFMHEVVGHGHPVGTPRNSNHNNAHDINRFCMNKLGLRVKNGYRNPHRGYKGGVKWPTY